MKQEGSQPKNDPAQKGNESVPSLKERIEQLKEHNEFLEDPMKENITRPPDDEQEQEEGA